MGKFSVIKLFLRNMAIQILFLLEPISVKCVFQGTYNENAKFIDILYHVMIFLCYSFNGYSICNDIFSPISDIDNCFLFFYPDESS